MGDALTPAHKRSAAQIVARCLADLEGDSRWVGDFDRASSLLESTVWHLLSGDGEAAGRTLRESGLPAEDLLDLLLRSRQGVLTRNLKSSERATREEAADAALRVLARRPEPERRLLERSRFEQQSAVHRQLMRLQPDGVLTVRPTGELVHANPGARSILGLRFADIKRLRFQDLVPKPTSRSKRKRKDDLWSILSREEERQGREIDLQRGDGKKFPARLWCARVEGMDGAEPRFLVLFRDLTEIRHIRSRLLETEKLGAMAKIAGSVAHEIRNPLSTLFLNAELLEDELEESGALTPATREVLSVFREEIERLNEIIKNYLSLSKLGHTDFGPLDVNQVVAEFGEEMEETIRQRGLRLEVRLCRGQVRVRADRNMLRRVLINLVENAMDATPADGRIVIATRRLTHKVKITVLDTGPGIPAEAQAQLFQPFFSTKERGTGLGLYLIREIVMAHDGEIAIDSLVDRGKGTRVKVYLPLGHGRRRGKRGAR